MPHNGADVGTDLIDGHYDRCAYRSFGGIGADVGTDLIDGHRRPDHNDHRVPRRGADVGTDLIDGHSAQTDWLWLC